MALAAKRYFCLKGAEQMNYQNEWLLLEAEDEIDEVEHRPPTEEFLFYQAVTNGDVEAVRKNCEQKRFLDGKGGRGVVTESRHKFKVPFCDYHGDGYADVQAERDGAGAGFSDERFLYSETG